MAVSSFGTLLYYVVTNLSALRLAKEQRMFPRVLAVAGLIGCLALAFALAPEDVGIGLAILLAGIVFRTRASACDETRREKLRRDPALNGFFDED